MKRLRIGVIGCGQRGQGLVSVTLSMKDIDVVALCDEYEDRAQFLRNVVFEKKGFTPFVSTDYRDIISREDVDAVIVATSWEEHIKISIAAMKAGKYVGVEVGGAFSIEDCWRLVQTSEETGIPCMMLENCCYGEYELMCLNMAEKRAFGEIVHCTGAYLHDLRNEVSGGEENRHYRLRQYTYRNCDNYPTHALGPIAKILKINRGNRFVSLTSMSSKARGLKEYIIEKNGADHPLANVDFAQGDVTTTIIKCANGETIRLTLNITTPRAYSRDFGVFGTKGYYEENANVLFLDRDEEKYGPVNGTALAKKLWDNAEGYKEEFGHPLWLNYRKEGIKAGHGGMDWLVLRAFYESAMEKKEPPIDVYDTAAWMSISVLTEQSILNGGSAVAIPDFTNGKWIKDRNLLRNEVPTYSLQAVPQTIEFK